MRSLLLACSAALAATPGAIAHAETPPAHAWQIGPIIQSRNYSVGMPSTPLPSREGWYFDFPTQGEGHVHYLTFRHGSLSPRSEIVLRYRIDAAPGTQFIPHQTPEYASRISLFFQRAGDNWSGRGRYEHYRWYAPAESMQQVASGIYEIRVGLNDGNWISVLGKLASSNPGAFATALSHADRVGFVFGSDAGRGHGVYATGPARFTLLDFDIR